jgi:hypothetical protein
MSHSLAQAGAATKQNHRINQELAVTRAAADVQHVRSFKDLPPLAGIATMADAMKPGLAVDECVARLKRYHYAFKRLHQIFTARITAEPIYELKTAFSLHAWLCAEHVEALRSRVAEMREPPLHLEAVPDPSMEIFFDEILAAPGSELLVSGLYGVALPELLRCLKNHIATSNPLADHPTIRVCKFAIVEIQEMLVFGSAAIERLKRDDDESISWRALLQDCLAGACGMDGAATPAERSIVRRYSATRYEYDPLPKRDARFIDPYNRGVNPEAVLYDQSMPGAARVLMLFFKRLREIDVPEMMAGIITQTPGKPWEYYRQMSRQLWDEARHAMMGEVGFNSLGVDWSKIPIPWGWSLMLNTRLTALERHAVLYFIEQTLMPRTGKRFEWEVCVAAGNPLAALFQDYDWADEVLHAAIGRRWLADQFGSAAKAQAAGEQAFKKVQSQPEALPGQTDHHNWWPEVYMQACQAAGTTPDPRVRDFDVRYGAANKLAASG